MQINLLGCRKTQDLTFCYSRNHWIVLLVFSIWTCLFAGHLSTIRQLPAEKYRNMYKETTVLPSMTNSREYIGTFFKDSLCKCVSIYFTLLYLHKPSLHKGPTFPSMQSVRQVPFTGKHWLTSTQKPHLPLHSRPYRPMLHSKISNKHSSR